MIYRFQLDDSTPEAKAFLKYIQTLDYVKVEEGYNKHEDNVVRENSEVMDAYTTMKDEKSTEGEDDFTIPNWQKEELDKRVEEYRVNPDSAMDFNEAMRDVEKDL